MTELRRSTQARYECACGWGRIVDLGQCLADARRAHEATMHRRGYGGGYAVPDRSAECYVIIGGDRCTRGRDHAGEHATVSA